MSSCASACASVRCIPQQLCAICFRVEPVHKKYVYEICTLEACIHLIVSAKRYGYRNIQ